MSETSSHTRSGGACTVRSARSIDPPRRQPSPPGTRSSGCADGTVRQPLDDSASRPCFEFCRNRCPAVTVPSGHAPPTGGAGGEDTSCGSTSASEAGAGTRPRSRSWPRRHSRSRAARATPAGGGGAQAGECERVAPPSVPAASAQPAPEAPKADASRLKVGLAYDIGGRGDASFNDAAAAGLDRAVAELGLQKANTREATAQAGESEDAGTNRLRQLAQSGFNPIIAVGFNYATGVKTVATEFPNVQFAIVDDDTVELPNVKPLVFAEEQGSFLVGAAAALKTSTCKVGFIGGVDNPLIQKFDVGYAQGAKAVAPSIDVESAYISPAGDFTGFNDATRATEIASGQYDGGADISFAAAGQSNQGVRRGADRAEEGHRRRLRPVQLAAADPGPRHDHDVDDQAGRRGGLRLRQRGRGQHRRPAPGAVRPRQQRCRLLHLRWPGRRHRPAARAYKAAIIAGQIDVKSTK